MKVASVILLILTHHGLWFGGQENSVTVRPVVQAGWPEAVVKWELGLGALKIAEGTAALPAGGGDKGDGIAIPIKLPEIRAHSVMTFSCHVFRKDDGRELGAQEAAIDVFPPVDFGSLAERYAQKKLLVIDRPESIPAILKNAAIPSITSEAGDSLLAPRQDAIVVGEQQLEDSARLRKGLVGQAQAGASILILRQKTGPLLEFPIAGRRAPGSYKLEADHPLLDGLTPLQWQAALADGTSDVPAIQLPVDAAALAVVSFPQELATNEPGPIDALLVVQATGSGRIVYCQLPLTDFDHDPAAGLFLRNALAYLLTRPEPTPPPSERPATQPQAEPKIPTRRLQNSHTLSSITRLQYGVLTLSALAPAAFAADPATKPATLTVAVLNFDATLPGEPDFGKQLADTVAASLAGEPGFSLIERAAMSHVLAEHELNMTGLVDTDKAVKIGHLIGASILITGRVIPSDKHLTVTAKLIGTETSLVDVVLVKGKVGDDSTDLGTAIGDKVAQRLRDSGSKLLATETVDPFNDLKTKLAGKSKPVIAINVSEMHVTSPRTIDPAVDTELRKMLTESGFDVVDKDEDPGKRGVEVIIKGEAISEFGGRVSNINTCSGRVELKLVTFKDGKTLFADRETAQSAGLQENIAAKAALQKAAHAIGLRILDHFAQTLPEGKK